MNRIARIAIALSTLGTLATAATFAAAQPYSDADQARRERNRAEVLAKHPQARRQVSAPMADADANKPLVRDPIARVGRKAYRASSGFAERQSAKVRRVGKRVENALPPNPEKKAR